MDRHVDDEGGRYVDDEGFAYINVGMQPLADFKVGDLVDVGDSILPGRVIASAPVVGLEGLHRPGRWYVQWVDGDGVKQEWMGDGGQKDERWVPESIIIEEVPDAMDLLNSS